ncbi:DUF790 family protein [Deinococcus peraridilitoris]|uniref:DUF790-containing protein n=1 Tax=Deinococcus peraridilitoris (strain DSM 19664 / LMG 22246 / CIP 109416 / KR-200) TaxID=937777 RepID=L0A1N8_DEIPD|nr:DUF790 family protein [Deinococcus peraridilitoris]AFZ67746.1 hypothetical protein Deipe_2265 [Deinococcus peraridilitoris DSM 19664]
MLPTELLLYRYRDETVVPKRLALSFPHQKLAGDLIEVFRTSVGLSRAEVAERVAALEGSAAGYRVVRGMAHLLAGSYAKFEMRAPIEPTLLRARVFGLAAHMTGREARPAVLAKVAAQLSQEGIPLRPEEVESHLYADLTHNHVLSEFSEPTPDELLHRYNLAQVQGILYRAYALRITAHRNEPARYKQLLKYLKLFGLMVIVEGDAEHGFTLTLDGPSSLFRPSTRYGLAMAKLLPALLHVTRWTLSAELRPRGDLEGGPEVAYFELDSQCGLVSHYKIEGEFDSIVEEAFAARWAKQNSEWTLEREVDLVPVTGGVIVPDFRLFHPDGRSTLLEIVGYWRPEYLRKKFRSVNSSGRTDLILAVSERLNLEAAGVKVGDLPPGVRLVFFKGRLEPKAVLEVLEE